MSLASFVKYNNALPVALSFLLLSFGGALAASPEVRGSIYSEEERVVSVDNTYIANKDLNTFTPRVQITGVTEDENVYYVHYQFTTIGLKDAVWRDLSEDKIMEVAKASIEGKDLGLYVTEQLKQNIDRELARLREVQEIERKHISQKVISTAYSGLVGKLLDDTTETLPGYVPVVVPVAAPVAEETASGEGGASVPAAPAVNNTVEGDNTPPTLQILGNNPARILVQSRYVDLGVVVTDNVNTNLGYKTFLNDTLTTDISISTAQPGTWIIRYEATDQAGNTASAMREVEVYDPNAPAASASTVEVQAASSSEQTASSTSL